MKPFVQDPIFVWLMCATFAFTAIMVGVAIKLPDHVPLFTVLQGLTTGFAGAVLARVKPQSKDDGLETKSQVKITESAVPTVGSKDNG